MVKSLAKGKRFEREVCKILSEATGKEWKRVPMSGAFSTRENINDTRFKGDVFCEDFKDVVVECKNISGKKIIINDLFNTKSQFHKFVKQAERESGDREWLLFIKYSKGKILLVYDMRISYDLVKYVEKMIKDAVVLYEDESELVIGEVR